MKHFLISICLIGFFLELSGLLFSIKSEQPSESFVKLQQPPARTINHPLENGYFLLLGLTAAAGRDPVQTGYDIWLESDSHAAHGGFNFNKAGRSDLRLPASVERLIPAWEASNPLEALHKNEPQTRSSAEPFQTLTARYERWLTMAFEDWGYAHYGAPRTEEILGTHRLYIMEGFRRQPSLGLQRLSQDIKQWRMVLRDARTPTIKILATVMLDDSAQLLSRIMSQDHVDHALLAKGLPLLTPLTSGEYSLQWPLQSQFTLTYTRHHSPTSTSKAEPEQDWTLHENLAHAAHLRPNTFQQLDHPLHRTALAASPDHQRTWNTLATYYEATITAANSVHSPLPTMHDIAAHSTRTFFERLSQPLDFEPEWTPISHRLVELDARLRLVSLQILLHTTSTTLPMPVRLAEIGGRYFDPFTGLPMLWSPTQHRIYSVGPDHLDDGGDPSFDISIPVPPRLAESARHS